MDIGKMTIKVQEAIRDAQGLKVFDRTKLLHCFGRDAGVVK